MRNRYLIGLLLVWSGVAHAQVSWKAAADSSNAWFAKGNFEKAYAFSLTMIAEAEPLHAQNPADTTLITSLVRAGISQRLALKPDTAKGLAHATRALNLLTPALTGRLLEAKVYSLNAIFNYMVGQQAKALFCAEIAADRLEKLQMTASSPYWEAQRYRVAIYQTAKDSVSLSKAVAVLRQTLPVTGRTFGKGSSQYYILAKAWATMLQGGVLLTDNEQTEADSVWETYLDASRRQAGARDLQETNILYDAANYYSSVGRNEKAAEFASRMLAKAEAMYAADAGHDTTLIYSLSLMANYRYQLSQLHIQEALQYVDRAITLLKPAYESQYLGAELYALSGRLRWNAGNKSLALAHSQKAITLFAKLKQTGNLTYIQTQMILAAIYSSSYDKDQLAAARQILESLVPIVTRMSGPTSKPVVIALGMLGTVYTMSMPLDDSTQRRADELWQTLIPTARKLGDSEQLCRMLTGMGEHYIARNQTDLARIALQESIKIGKTLTNQIYRLIALTNLSTVEIATGHSAEAAIIADEALAAPEMPLLPQMMLTLAANAIDGNLQLGRLDRAEALARQAMKLAEEQHGNQTNYFYAISLGGLGTVYNQRSDFSKATRYLEESLDLLEQTARPDDPVLSRIRTIMGDIYASIDKEKALYNYQKARQSMERQPNYGQSNSYLPVLRSQMAILRELGRLQESAQLADSTIRAYNGLSVNDKNSFPLFLEDAYYTYYRAGRQADADSIQYRLEQILGRDTLSDAARSMVLSMIGSAHKSSGNYQEAIRHFSEAIRYANVIHGNNSSNNLNAYVHVKLALCYLSLGNRPEATRILTESVDRLRQNVTQNLWYMSEGQREAYMDSYTLSEIYGMAFQSAVPTDNELALAYDYRLLIQGILLSTGQQVLREAANQSNTLLRQRLQHLFAIRKTIAQFSLRPSQYVDVDSLQELSTKLEKQIGYFAGTIRQQTKAYTWQDVRKSLKPGEAAVEIIRFNRWQFELGTQETDTVHYAALVIRPDWSVPHLVVLPNGNELESTGIQQYRNAIESTRPNGTAYKQFWSSIARQLQGVQKVFVAPDGVYHLVSLPTLYNASQKRYLADEMQIVVVGSTREVATHPKHRVSSTGLLVGSPAYRATYDQSRTKKKLTLAKASASARNRGGISFEELPATETEVNDIARLLTNSGIKTTTRTRAEASESVLKMASSPRVLHVATHGFFMPDSNGMFKANRLLACGLVLAGAADSSSRLKADDEDGILTGYEASLLNLGQTELVTLSACETGVGNSRASEGVFGLQRAFLLAGAQSVLMSLWKVNDQLTQQLMSDFYRFWLAGSSKPQALRQAQMNLRKQHPEPYYWGAFVLLGQ